MPAIATIARYVFGLLVAALLGAAGNALAQTILSPSTSQVFGSGELYAVAPHGTGVVIAGQFAYVNGVARNNIARLNSDGSLDATWNPNADGAVHTLAIDVSGNVFAGGSFTSIGGQSRNRIVKLSGSGAGAADAIWNPGASGTVYSMCLDGTGTLYAAGAFTTIGGQPRNRIAKLGDSGTGTVDATWNPGANNEVRVLRVDPPSSMIYAGGSFTSIGGQSRASLARLSTSSTGAADATWNPAPGATVHAIVIDGSSSGVFVGGTFSSIGGQSRVGIAKISINGAGLADAAWNANSSGSVLAMDLGGSGKLLVGGNFTQIGGQAYAKAARLLTSNGIADPWNVGIGPSTSNSVNALAIGPGKIYLGGSFPTIGSQARGGFAAIDGPTAASDSAMAKVLNSSGEVHAISRDPAQRSAARTVVGGKFMVVGDKTTVRVNLARFNADGTLDSGWDPSPDDSVAALAHDTSGNLYAGGDFNKIGATSRNYLAKLSSAGTVDATWNPSPNQAVWSLAADASGNLYAAGGFSSIGGASRFSIAKLSTSGTGSADATWNPAPDSTVNTLALDGGTSLYVGGDFLSIGGASRNRLAKLSTAGAGAADGSWNPNANNSVTAIAYDASGVVASGNFTNVGGATRNYIVKISPSSGAVDATWVPNPDNTVNSLLADGAGSLYAGGHFTSIGGQARNRLALLSLSGSGAADASWNPSANQPVYAMALESGPKVHVGGAFSSIVSTAWSGYAVLSGGGSAPNITSAAPPGGTVGVPYTHAFTVTGSPAPTLLLATGSLPPGLSLSSGVISGTPTAAGTFAASVTATNASGSAAQAFAITIISVPGAPTIGTATAGNAQAMVSFSAPSSNGGSAITSYTATSSPGGITASASASPITLNGLTNGTAYTFTVTATNAVGTGPASAASNSVTPSAAPTAPGVPTSVAATSGNQKATISFSAPASNGGSAITGYTVTCNPGNVTATATSSPIQVTGLTNGTQYTCTVKATNAIGTGSASAAVTVTPAAPAAQTPAISSTASHSLALDANGKVYAWGNDSYGQLGQGRPISRSTPAQIAGIPAMAQVSMQTHVVAVDVFKQVWSWGENLVGQLGPRDQSLASKPARVIGASGMVRVAAGYGFSVALRTDGTVWAWGNVPGYTTNALTDVGYRQVTGLSGITDIVAGSGHALALKSDGTVWAFGYNDAGQLGTGTTGANQSAVQVAGVTGATSIAASTSSSLALLANGQLKFWGRGGDQVVRASAITLPAPSGTVAAISISSNLPVIARSDGSTAFFDSSSWLPLQFTGISRITGSGLGLYLAIGAGGQLYALGSNQSGQLGQGNTDPYPNTVVSVPGLTSVASVTTSNIYPSVIALKSDGSLWFFGGDTVGQSGDGAVIGSSVPKLVNIPATIKAIATGAQYSLALDTSGNVWAWGLGAWDSTRVSRSTPTVIPGVANVTAIAAGGTGPVLYLIADGSVKLSGTLTPFIAAADPAPVAGLSGVTAIAAGNNAYALAGGTLMAWGPNDFGDLGNGTTTPSATPVAVQGISGTIKQIAASQNRAAAVTTDGKVWSWGAGPPGNGTSGASLTAVAVSGVSDASEVSVGTSGGLILRQNGGLLAWGVTLLKDAAGQNSLVPYTVAFHEAIRAIRMTSTLSTGFLIGNTGLAWGFGTNGAVAGTEGSTSIGDGTYVMRDRPVVLSAPDGGGSLDANDWYLDLEPATTENIPTASVPKALGVSRLSSSGAGITFEATMKYKAADYGKKVNNYAFGLVPAEFFGLVKNAPGTPSIAELKRKAAARKATFILAQLTPLGWTNVSGQLIAYSQATANASGSAANILNGVPATQIPGARFCIGYGESSGSMLSVASLREVLLLEGASSNDSGVPCVLTGLYVDGPPSSTVGSAVTFRSSVVGLSPTGSIQFKDGAAPLQGAVTLSGASEAVATGSISTSTLTIGVHSIGGIYGGDTQNASVSAEVPLRHEVVSVAPGVSVTSIAGGASSDSGSTVAFTATVTGASPSGTVQFMDGSTSLGDVAALVGGLATLRTSSLSVGAHSITAVYSGDTANTTSTSSALAHTVYSAITTTIALSANPSSGNVGTPVTLTATVTGSSPSGTITFRDGGTVLGTGTLSNGVATLTLPALDSGPHAITAEYAGDTNNQAVSSAAAFVTLAVPGQLNLDPAAYDFAGQSLRTTQTRAFTVFNTTSSSVSVSSVSVGAGYAVLHDCATLVVGATCTATVSFTPTTEGAVNATLTVVTSAGTQTASLTGSGEKSLTSHYYRSILRRAPDSAGKAYWDGEAARVSGLGANVNETWFAMAMSFYFSSEYVAFNRNPTEYVRDLYSTFFNRSADNDGLNYWTGQMASGLPREVVLVAFMFSTEFANFASTIFGNTAVRAEVDTVVDFYRGLLSRLPDSAGFNYWVSQFRTAQCAGASAVYTQVEAISVAYAESAEYTARNRSNTQYMADLYNAFLRRGGDLAGVQFWINQLDTGARTRSKVRQDFIASPEFSQRVANIISTGCLR